MATLWCSNSKYRKRCAFHSYINVKKESSGRAGLTATSHPYNVSTAKVADKRKHPLFKHGFTNCILCKGEILSMQQKEHQ
ncbi:hypothetical protein BDE02_02G082800 [Populus trichocarpa]|nr:hypothetical protein BDE02_02G082800 [Populus trichocarpa]